MLITTTTTPTHTDVPSATTTPCFLFSKNKTVLTNTLTNFYNYKF